MTSKHLFGFALALAAVPGLCGVPLAQEVCPDCGRSAVLDYTPPCPADWLELGAAFNDVSDSAASHYQYGQYPQDWLTSGRLHLGPGCLRRERFELRWWDVTSGNGRSWSRAAYYPLTLESDAALSRSYAWDSLGPDPALQQQQVALDGVKLRYHRGELDNVVLSYDRGEFNRKAGNLGSYNYERVGLQYNFHAVRAGKLRGQFKQTGTEYDAALREIDNRAAVSALKLDAALTGKLDAYGRATQASYKSGALPDGDASSVDYTLGVRYRPTALLELDTSFRSKTNADDNTVSSHVAGYDEYGVKLSYTPCGGGRYEAGYDHRSLDYTRLRLVDAGVADLLRASAVLKPGDLAGHYDKVSPAQDHYWYSLSRQLGRKLNFSSRLDYRRGDTPQTTLGEAYTPALFSDQNTTHQHTLTYSYDAANELALTYHGQQAMNGDRGTDYGMKYYEGSWWHGFGGGRSLLLGYRATRTDLDIPTLLDVFNTDDDTYLASFNHELPGFSYGLNLSRTSSTGYEAYTETAAGANLGFKRLGPVGLRVDWSKRQYGNVLDMATRALEVALTYRFNF